MAERKILVGIGDADETYCNGCPKSISEINYDQNTRFGYSLRCKEYEKKTKRKQAIGIRLPACIAAEVKD
jgi:hypothetical protein